MQAALAPDATGHPPQHNLRAVFARRGFRRLLAVRLISQLGDGWFQAGLASSVFFNPEEAASPAAIALAFAVLLVPYSTLGPFVGVFLDRWSRRTSLFVANLVRAALVVPAAAFVWFGNEGPLFVAAALGVVACNRFFLAGLSAALPHVVEPERLVTANSFATTAGTVCYATGLGTAGFAFAVAGAGLHPYASAAGTAALAYGLAAILLRMSFPRGALGPDHIVIAPVLRTIVETARGMVDGVRHLGQRRGALAVMLVQAGHRCLYGVLAITTLLLYRNYFAENDAGKSLVGLLPVAVGGAIGSLVAALLTPGVTRRIGGRRWVTGLMAGLAVLVPTLGLQYAPLAMVAASFVVGLATQATKIVTDTALQLEIADDYRGRIFSLNDTSFNLLFVVGIVFGAWILPFNGYAPVVMASIGVGYAVLATWYGLRAPRQGMGQSRVGQTQTASAI